MNYLVKRYRNGNVKPELEFNYKIDKKGLKMMLIKMKRNCYFEKESEKNVYLTLERSNKETSIKITFEKIS